MNLCRLQIGSGRVEQGQELFQCFHAHRLGDVQVKTTVVCALLICSAGPACMRDEDNVMGAALLADLLDHFVAVQPWHTNVDERHIGLEFGGVLDCCLPIVKGLGFVAERSKQSDERIGSGAVVVNDKDAVCHCAEG